MLPQPNFVYCLWHKIWATGYDLVDKVTVSNDDDIIPLSLYDCFKGFWAIWTTTNLEKLREKKRAVNYFLKSSILDVWLGSEYVSQILGFTKYCLRCDSYQNTTTYLKLLILNKYANFNKKWAGHIKYLFFETLQVNTTISSFFIVGHTWHIFGMKELWEGEWGKPFTPIGGLCDTLFCMSHVRSSLAQTLACTLSVFLLPNVTRN